VRESRAVRIMSVRGLLLIVLMLGARSSASVQVDALSGSLFSVWFIDDSQTALKLQFLRIKMYILIIVIIIYTPGSKDPRG